MLPETRRNNIINKIKVCDGMYFLTEQQRMEYSKKHLKVLLIEAVRAGFKKACRSGRLAVIIAVARKIPENLFQENPKLLMWYDQAFLPDPGRSDPCTCSIQTR